jgi:arylformamidase
MKGPRVFLDYDQAELDDCYDQLAYAPNRDQILARFSGASEVFRSRLGMPRRLSYGPTEIERLDLYPTRHANAPIEIFIHGGAWRGGLAKDYAFPAELFVAAGVHFAVLDFVWIQDAADGLNTIVNQVRRAIGWLHDNARSLGGDPERLFVAGHSSGAHLAAIMLTTDWRRDFGLPTELIKGGLCASGMYDLAPVRLSARSSYVKIDDPTEQALSPQRHVANLHAPLIVTCGALETPEFRRHARDFARLVGDAGKRVETLLLDGYNHFEVLETLGNPFGILGRAALAQIGASVPKHDR